jgi:ribosomal protein L17
MKNHNDELQQNIAQVSNRYNELKLLINNQRKLITEETIKSKDQMSQWLRKYIDNLIAEKAKIDTDIEETEKDAQVT